MDMTKIVRVVDINTNVQHDSYGAPMGAWGAEAAAAYVNRLIDEHGWVLLGVHVEQDYDTEAGAWSGTIHYTLGHTDKNAEPKELGRA